MHDIRRVIRDVYSLLLHCITRIFDWSTDINVWIKTSEIIIKITIVEIIIISKLSLTFELFAVGRAASLFQQAVYIVFEQTVARQNRFDVNIVILRRILLLCQNYRYDEEEQSQDLDWALENSLGYERAHPEV